MTAGQGGAVTGGRGIGAAIVKRLASDGADVAFTCVSKADEATKTAETAKSLGGRALAVQANAADADAVVRAAKQAAKAFGGSTSWSTTCNPVR